jgi:hypothetical protein
MFGEAESRRRRGLPAVALEVIHLDSDTCKSCLHLVPNPGGDAKLCGGFHSRSESKFSHCDGDALKRIR